MTEPLRMANRLSQQELYQWPIFGVDDQVIEASDGITITPSHAITQTQDLYALIVVSGLMVSTQQPESLHKWLRNIDRSATILGATSAGPYTLAEAGLLRGRKCTVHWEQRSGFIERFPTVELTNNLFEITDNLWTCSGGTAGLDFMLEVIRRDQGDTLAKAVAEQSVHPTIRDSQETQQMSPITRYNIHNARLNAAVALMEANIETPLSIDQIASQASVSKRHLERLFDQQIGQRPGRFYTAIRLRHARGLLRQTALPVSTVAALSGFSTSAYFTRRYKHFFGTPPKDDRCD